MKTIEELCEDMVRAQNWLDILGSINQPLTMPHQERIKRDVQYKLAQDDYRMKADAYRKAIDKLAEQGKPIA